MVEVTHHEKVVLPLVFKELLHGYPEDFSTEILTYTLNEIFAEKCHAILQNTKKIHERTWSRSRARDYYDLWRLLQTFRTELDADTILKTLILKCEGRGVSYTSTNDFFDPKALEAVQRDWVQWLSPMVCPLPSYETVISETQQELRSFLG